MRRSAPPSPAGRASHAALSTALTLRTSYLGRWAFCGDPLCVVPLCRRPCHRAYDSGELDLLPHLEPEWRAQLAHAVGHVGLIGALRRISGATMPR